MHSKAIIKIDYTCNNRCIFCHARGKENIFSGFDDIIKKIERLKEIDCILFSGGEPTIRKDLYKIMDYASNKGFVLGLVTNGRRLAYYPYLKKLKEKGLEYVNTSLLSSKKEMHNALTKSDSFDQTIKGIKNSLNAGLETLVNIVVLKENLYHVKETARFLESLGVKKIKISLVEPTKQYNKIHIPDLIEASKIVKETLKEVSYSRWDGFPHCIMKRFEDRFLNLITEKIILISEANEKKIYPVSFEQERKFNICKNCKMKEICEGIPHTYIKSKKGILKPY